MADYQFNWNKPYRSLSSSIIIGEVNPHPDIHYRVLRRACRWNSLAQQDDWATSYDVDYEIDGCSSTVVCWTQEEVTQYLDHQASLMPQYLELIGKRDTLQNRIEPLKNKSHNYGNQIIALAKER